jgi:hypothetical protein
MASRLIVFVFDVKYFFILKDNLIDLDYLFGVVVKYKFQTPHHNRCKSQDQKPYIFKFPTLGKSQSFPMVEQFPN